MSDSIHIAIPVGVPNMHTLGRRARSFYGRIQNAQEQTVVAKDCSGGELVREVLCNRLARLLELPVPEAFVVDTLNSSWQCQERYVYASSTQGEYSPYAHRPRDNPTTDDYLLAWPHLVRAVLFDEWTANNDRNPNNLLFAGRNKFLLIDHGEAMPHSFDESILISRNYFAAVLALRIGIAKHQRQEVVKQCDVILRSFRSFDLSKLEVMTLREAWANNQEFQSCVDFLAKRLQYLPQLIEERLGQGVVNLFANDAQ